MKVNLANFASTKVEGRDIVKILAENQHRLVEFQNTLFVPDLRANLVSVAKITDQSHEVIFKKNSGVVTSQEREVKITAYRKGDLYYVQEGTEHVKVAACETGLQMRLWHDRMGHLNTNDLKKVMLRCGI